MCAMGNPWLIFGHGSSWQNCLWLENKTVLCLVSVKGFTIDGLHTIACSLRSTYLLFIFPNLYLILKHMSKAITIVGQKISRKNYSFITSDQFRSRIYYWLVELLKWGRLKKNTLQISFSLGWIITGLETSRKNHLSSVWVMESVQPFRKKQP